MKHFSPKDGIYTLFRCNEEGKVMVVLSKSPENTRLDLSRFHEILPENASAVDVLMGRSVQLSRDLEVPPMGVVILDLE